MASAFCVYYSIWALFPTYLQRELHWSPKDVFVPVFFANLIVFGGSGLWGFVADKWGRRPGIYIPAIIGIFVTPIYLHTQDPTWIVAGFILQGLFARLDLRSEPELPLRALSHRGAGDGLRLRLSPGRDLRRPDRADPELLRQRKGMGYASP